MTGRRSYRAAAATATCVVLAACGSPASHGGSSNPTQVTASPLTATRADRRPVNTTPPDQAATRHCLDAFDRRGRGPRTPHSHRYVSVDTDPTSVEAAWFPGLGFTHCVEPVTRAGGKTAQLLAHDVDAARPLPPGQYSCPAEFERVVHLYFQYRGRPAETAVVALSGCESIGAPGRLSLSAWGPILKDLKSLTPDGWNEQR